MLHARKKIHPWHVRKGCDLKGWGCKSRPPGYYIWTIVRPLSISTRMFTVRTLQLKVFSVGSPHFGAVHTNRLNLCCLDSKDESAGGNCNDCPHETQFAVSELTLTRE